MIRKQREKPVWIDAQVHSTAKKISTLQGKSLKEYFSEKVQQDMPNLERDLQELVRRNGGKKFGPPF